MIKKLKELFNNHDIDDIFIDCMQGDKFMVTGFEYDEDNKKLTFKIHKKSVKWIELDGKYPVQLTTDKIWKPGE